MQHLQHFLRSLRILSEISVFAIIAFSLCFTVIWWKLIQHIEKQKLKNCPPVHFPQFYLSSLSKSAGTLVWYNQENQDCDHTAPLIKAMKQRRDFVHYKKCILHLFLNFIRKTAIYFVISKDRHVFNLNS